MTPADDPNWPRASDWLAGAHDPDPAARLSVIGAPVRLGSISGGRFDLAPAAVRKALSRFSTGVWSPRGGVDRVAVDDAGDVDVAERTPEEALGPLSDAIRVALPRADACMILGGDNSVTRPGVHGLGLPLERVGLLTVDAHFDLRDLDGGLTNGNPVRALIADGLWGGHVVQLGIQPFANSAIYREVADDLAIEWVPVDGVRRSGLGDVMEEHLAALSGAVDAIYVDLDLDVLDRAFAPACPGSRPGGLWPSELQTAARLCGEHPKVRAVDMVEVDPERDIADVTVLTAASCLLAFAAGLAARPN